MKRVLLPAAALAAVVLAGCGTSASKVSIRTTSAVTWPNLCKRINADLLTDGGDPVTSSGSDTVTVAVTGATAYATNKCTGSAITTATAASGSTAAVFYVKATALGTVNITVTNNLGKELGTGSLDVVAPTAELVLGQPNFTSNTANNGGIGAKTINDPWYVDTCGSKLVVADSANNRVLIWNTLPTANQTAADVVVGQPNMTSNASSTTQSTYDYPESVACSGNRLAVADYSNNRTLVYNTIPTTNGANASLVLGQPDFTTGIQPLSASASNNQGPTSVTATDTKLVTSDDGGWSRILIWNTFPTANNAAASIVLGKTDFTTTTNGSTSAATLNAPYLGRFRGDYFLVADEGNYRVLVWNAATLSNGKAADIVVGQPDGTTTNSPSAVNAKTFGSPGAADWDGDHLIVTDNDQNRILIWNGMPATGQTDADVVIGAPDFTTGGSGAATQTSFNAWQFSAGDGKGLWIADENNNRILKYPAP